MPRLAPFFLLIATGVLLPWSGRVQAAAPATESGSALDATPTTGPALTPQQLQALIEQARQSQQQRVAADSARQAVQAPPAAASAVLETRVSKLIADLQNTNWATRRHAHDELMRQPVAARPIVENALLSANDPEVKAQLESIALHLYMKAHTPLEGEASVLGIRLPSENLPHPGAGPGYVEIVDVLPGFNAAEVLKPGDQILAINGEQMPPDARAADVQRIVNPHPPDGPFHMVIRRDGVVMHVDVQPAGLPAPGLSALIDYSSRRSALAGHYLQRLDALVPIQSVVVGPGTDEPAQRAFRAPGDYHIHQPRLPGE